MCWRVGNAFLLSATVDDIGNGVIRTAIGCVRGHGRVFPGMVSFWCVQLQGWNKGRT
jgi:hypothetical protein